MGRSVDTTDVLLKSPPCHRDLEAPQGTSNKVSDVKSCIRWEISQPFGSPTFYGDSYIYIYIYIYYTYTYIYIYGFIGIYCNGT